MKKPILRDFPLPITTTRLVIRPPQFGDGAVINEAINETYAELRYTMPWAKTLPSVDETEEFVRKAVSNWILRENVEHLPLLIFDSVTGLFLGSTGYHHIDWEVPALEIGYWLRSAHQRRGIMTEAVNAVARYAFVALQMKRVEIRCDIQNQRSKKVAERLGFALEATLKNNRINPASGEVSGTLIYACCDLECLPKMEVSW